jgi:hypothetical protein
VPKPVILTASPPFTAEEIAYSIESKAFSASRLDSSDTSLILPMSSVLFTVTSLVIAEKSLQIQEQFPAEIKHPRRRPSIRHLAGVTFARPVTTPEVSGQKTRTTFRQ